MPFCDVLVIDRHCLATAVMVHLWLLSGQWIVCRSTFVQLPAPNEQRSHANNQTESTLIFFSWYHQFDYKIAATLHSQSKWWIFMIVSIRRSRIFQFPAFLVAQKIKIAYEIETKN